MTAHSRESGLAQWFYSVIGAADAERAPLRSVSGDASFRRYFRAELDGVSYVLMDAPPGKEDCAPFAAIAQAFLAAGIRVPRIHAMDLEQGYMCLEDFGDTLLWQPLDAARRGETRLEPARLYQPAFEELLKIQALPGTGLDLPPYDEALLRREMELFRHWLCERQLEMPLSAGENRLLDETFRLLIEAALDQPRVCVHRDYHSRNLMALPDGGVGILDFQDAVRGPFTYDLVSLLRDCYIDWPREEVRRWALAHLRQAVSREIVPEWPEEDFLRAFDLMGVQRHLKAAGIFCRLYLRDGKPGYLGSVPRTVGYIRQVARERQELEEFRVWLEERFAPALRRKFPPLPEPARS